MNPIAPQVPNKSASRGYYLILIVALVLLVASIVYLWHVRTHTDVTTQSVAQRTPESAKVSVVRTEVDTRELPKDFPQDLPLEANAVVTQNYTAVVNNSTQQASRTYESSKSLADNYKLYQTYLQDHDWLLVSQVEQNGYDSLTGLKDGKTIQILISENSGTKVIVVDLSITTPTVTQK